jgi:hypothetical protein
MISVVHNHVLNAIQIQLDVKGADLLIDKLQTLKSRQELGHVHLYATNDDRGLSTGSPYRDDVVYGELILDLLPPDA